MWLSGYPRPEAPPLQSYNHMLGAIVHTPRFRGPNRTSTPAGEAGLEQIHFVPPPQWCRWCPGARSKQKFGDWSRRGGGKGALGDGKIASRLFAQAPLKPKVRSCGGS